MNKKYQKNVCCELETDSDFFIFRSKLHFEENIFKFITMDLRYLFKFYRMSIEDFKSNWLV